MAAVQLRPDEWASLGAAPRAAVFIDPCAQREAFTDAMTDRAFIVLDDFTFTSEQYGAVSQAAAAVGDDWCLAELLAYSEDRHYWRVDLGDYASYLAGGLDEDGYRLENALISPTAQWGITITEDLWGVAGGVAPFMDVFRAAFRSADWSNGGDPEDPAVSVAKVRQLLSQGSRSGLDAAASLLTHVCGGERAATILAEVGWDDPPPE